MLKVAKCLATCVWLCAFLGWCSGQAPGDADARCTVNHNQPPVYPDTVRNLMDSYHYVTLLPGNGTGNPPLEGAVWNDRSFDTNDVTDSVSPTYWQQGAGGICRFQTRACGYRQGWQDNWLFTQHIHQDFDYDPNTYNYPVKIRIELTYGTVSCRERNGCKESFFLHYYPTNEKKLPSTQGTGFMNTDNYEQFAEVRPEFTSRAYPEIIYSFTLPSDLTGFYIGIQDNGTCVGVSRLRVYRNNCKAMQSGLVFYPDAPAPVSDSQTLDITCVDNAVVSGSAQVTCGSDGRWGSENPVCQCRLGYENRTTECVACPAGQYRSADDTTCQQCPDNTVTDQVAAPLCECVDGYFRNNESRFSDKIPFSQRIEKATNSCTQPGPVRDLQSGCQIVIWQAPQRPNGVILHYQLTFTRDSETTKVNTVGAQTYFVIDELPGSSGEFTVEVVAVNVAGEGDSLCQLKVNPDNLELQRCVLCPEQTVGYVYYPVTAAPEEGMMTSVNTQCVENAEQTSSSLVVTCNPDGIWGNENPQCECTHERISDTECSDPTEKPSPPSPTPTPTDECSTCPGDINVAVDVNLKFVYVIWSPVNGALQYSLRLKHNGIYFLNITVDVIVYAISLSDELFKDKEFTIEIGTKFTSASSEEVVYSEPIEVNAAELSEDCDSNSTETDSKSLIIAIVVTFVVTALAVSFLVVVIGLIVCSCKSRKAKMDLKSTNRKSSDISLKKDYYDK